jgi:hypothetical protein
MRIVSRTGFFILSFSMILLLSGLYLVSSQESHLAQSGNSLGIITEFSGAPQIRNDGDPFWRPIAMNEEVYNRQKIKTGGEDLVTIKTHKDELIHVAENSTITLQDSHNAPTVKVNMGNMEILPIQKESPSSNSSDSNSKDQSSHSQDSTTQDSQPEDSTQSRKNTGKEGFKKTPQPVIKEIRKVIIEKKIIQIKTQNEKLDIAAPTSDLALVSPENKTTQIIKDLHNPQVLLSWVGLKNNPFNLEVAVNNNPSQSFESRDLQKKISLKEQAQSGQIKWRVTDLKTNKVTDWFSFFYIFEIKPRILKPLSGASLSLIRNEDSQSSSAQQPSPLPHPSPTPAPSPETSLFSVMIQSIFKYHELEILSPEEKVSLRVQGSSTFITTKSLPRTSFKQDKIPLTLRVRSFIQDNHWTDWSDPILLTLNSSSPLSLHFSTKTTVAKFSCDPLGWKCLEPIHIQLSLDRHSSFQNNQYQFQWFLPGTSHRFLSPAQSLNTKHLTSLNSNQTQTQSLWSCPPFPHSQWRFKIIKAHSTHFVESKETQISSVVTHAPFLDANQSYILSTGETFLSYPYCPHTKTKVSLYHDQKKPYEKEIIDSTTALLKTKQIPEKNLTPHRNTNPTTHNSNPLSSLTETVWVQSQFLDLQQQPLSDPSSKHTIKKIQPPRSLSSIDCSDQDKLSAEGDPENPSSQKNKNQNSLTKNKKEKQPGDTDWILKDAGELYVASTQTQAWSPISWTSDPMWSQYEYEIAQDPDFSKIIESKKIKTKSLKILIPQKSKAVYWRVRGLSKTKAPTQWSETRRIRVRKLKNATYSNEEDDTDN